MGSGWGWGGGERVEAGFEDVENPACVNNR